MSRHVKVPTHILDSKISNSAKVLWIEFARVATPKRPQVSANTTLLAERMRLSVRSIQRLIRELVKAELLVHNGYINGRVKVYHVVYIASKKKNLPALIVKETPPVQFPEPGELTPQILEEWSRRFPSLDGQAGRPTLVQSVEQAVNHPLRNTELSLVRWVEQCLKKDARQYAEDYWRERYHLDQRFSDAVNHRLQGVG